MNNQEQTRLIQTDANAGITKDRLDMAMAGIKAVTMTVAAMRDTPVTHNQREGQIQLIQDMLTKLYREVEVYGELPF